MNHQSRSIQRTYLTLILGNTLAASMIWGINTLFLLDAGLTNLEAFAANAFFTAGMMLFEIPTGIIADTWGRRTSYLLGTITLALSTLLYYFMWVSHAPFWEWAAISMFIGLGFTFFSGAVEAWLVDALKFTKYSGNLEAVFGKGQIVGGVAMLIGSVAGGLLAQVSNLGIPFLVRVGLLVITFIIALFLMRDLGFAPERGKKPVMAMQDLFKSSLKYGLKNPPVRWLMLAAPFSAGVGIYTFYALQPFLLELYGDSSAYTIAGLAAAIFAGSQMAGGFLAPHISKVFKKRTTALIFGISVNVVILALLGVTNSFIIALVLLVIWGLIFASIGPIRQSYLNGMIPSKQRATVLSFDSLMGSSGGVVIQPVLGKAADVWSYGTSYIVAAGIQVLSLPFLLLSRKQKSHADTAVVPKVPELPVA